MKDQMKGHSPKLNTTAEEMFWLEKQTALVQLVSFLQKITIPQIWQTLLLAIYVRQFSPLQIVFLFKVILHTCSHLDWQAGTFWELKNGNKKPLFISELVETFEYGTIEMMRQPFWLPEEPRSHRIDVDKSQAGKRAEDQKDFSNQQ